MLLEAASLKSFAHSLIYEYLGKTGVKLADFCGDIIGALLILFIGFKIVSYVVKMAHKIFERSIMDTTLQTFLLSFIKIGGKVLVSFYGGNKDWRSSLIYCGITWFCRSCSWSFFTGFTVEYCRWCYFVIIKTISGWGLYY